MLARSAVTSSGLASQLSAWRRARGSKPAAARGLKRLRIRAYSAKGETIIQSRYLRNLWRAQVNAASLEAWVLGIVLTARPFRPPVHHGTTSTPELAGVSTSE